MSLVKMVPRKMWKCKIVLLMKSRTSIWKLHTVFSHNFFSNIQMQSSITGQQHATAHCYCPQWKIKKPQWRYTYSIDKKLKIWASTKSFLKLSDLQHSGLRSIPAILHKIYWDQHNKSKNFSSPLSLLQKNSFCPCNFPFPLPPWRGKEMKSHNFCEGL